MRMHKKNKDRNFGRVQNLCSTRRSSVAKKENTNFFFIIIFLYLCDASSQTSTCNSALLYNADISKNDWLNENEFKDLLPQFAPKKCDIVSRFEKQIGEISLLGNLWKTLTCLCRRNELTIKNNSECCNKEYPQIAILGSNTDSELEYTNDVCKLMDRIVTIECRNVGSTFGPSAATTVSPTTLELLPPSITPSLSVSSFTTATTTVNTSINVLNGEHANTIIDCDTTDCLYLPSSSNISDARMFFTSVDFIVPILVFVFCLVYLPCCLFLKKTQESNTLPIFQITSDSPNDDKSNESITLKMETKSLVQEYNQQQQKNIILERKKSGYLNHTLSKVDSELPSSSTQIFQKKKRSRKVESSILFEEINTIKESRNEDNDAQHIKYDEKNGELEGCAIASTPITSENLLSTEATTTHMSNEIFNTEYIDGCSTRQNSKNENVRIKIENRINSDNIHDENKPGKSSTIWNKLSVLQKNLVSSMSEDEKNKYCEDRTLKNDTFSISSFGSEKRIEQNQDSATYDYNNSDKDIFQNVGQLIRNATNATQSDVIQSKKKIEHLSIPLS